jgi:hypothetical protein
MSIGDFVLAFVGIIIGLGVGDLLVSVHQLLRAGKRVKWHWATPTLAILMLFVTLALWWRSYLWFSDITSGTIADFLPKFLGMVVCFLMMAAALPDEVPESGIDLREFYMSSRVHLWSLMSVTLGGSIFIYFADHWSIGVAALLAMWWPTIISLALAVTAAAAPPRTWFHALAIGWISVVTLNNNLFTPIGQ